MRTALVSFVAVVTIFGALAASAVQVDYFTSTDNSGETALGLAHLVIALGYGEGDRNGAGSSAGGTSVGNGMPDGVEFSLFEYVYANDFATLPAGPLKTRLEGLHADAVANWSAHELALADIIDGSNDDGMICNGNGTGRLPFMEYLFVDSGVTPSYEFTVCTYAVGMFRSLVMYNTASLNLDYVSSLMGYLQTGNAANSYDFAGDPNFDNALGAVFDPTGDIDQDGATNLQEWNAVIAAVRALTPGWPDATGSNTLWNTIPAYGGTGGVRKSRELVVGWYIDAAVLNGSYSPSLFDLQNPPAPPSNEPTISVTPGTWVEVGDDVVFTAGPAGALSYQWYKDNAVIFGANSTTYTINSVTPGDAGEYFCRIDTGAKVIVDTPVVTIEVFGVGALPVGSAVGLGILLVLCAGVGFGWLRRQHA